MSDSAAEGKDALSKEDNTNPLAKIQPVKVEAVSEKNKNESAGDNDTSAENRANKNVENSLLEATQQLLRVHGIRKSGAAIRNAVEMPHESFMANQAVSALSALGFKSSFGNIKLKKLTPDFFPLIAFLNDGTAVVLREINDDNNVIIVEPGKKSSAKTEPLSAFEKNFSNYVILAKELNERERNERSGHWFFVCLPKK